MFITLIFMRFVHWLNDLTCFALLVGVPEALKPIFLLYELQITGFCFLQGQSL